MIKLTDWYYSSEAVATFVKTVLSALFSLRILHMGGWG